MLFTLPLILFIVLTELSIGAFTVLFVLDWRNQVKRNFLVLYTIVYIVLSGLTYWFQQGYTNTAFLNSFSMLDKSWTGYLALPLLLFLLLMVVYAVFLLADKKAGVDGKVEGRTIMSRRRLLRLIVGSLTSLAGLVTLFVLGMIFRPLASSSVAGVFIVGSFFAAALALGGVMTAMWLGHWYLVTPALSEKPLQFAATLVLLGVLIEAVFAFAGGTMSVAAAPRAVSTPTPAVTATATATPGASTTPGPQVKPASVPTIAPLSVDAIGWLRILVGFAMPLVLLVFILKLIHDRSFQSATGMLYLVVVLTLAGEALARGLFLIGLQ
jgi:DMSO reductase anchor subunit